MKIIMVLALLTLTILIMGCEDYDTFNENDKNEPYDYQQDWNNKEVKSGPNDVDKDFPDCENDVDCAFYERCEDNKCRIPDCKQGEVIHNHECVDPEDAINKDD